MKIEINNKLYQDIENYCKINNLDIEFEINKYVKTGFNCEKYGDLLYVSQNTIHGTFETEKVGLPLEEVKTEETKVEEPKEQPKVVKHKIRIIEND